MFRDHSNCIWGTRCRCGSDVYILQNKHHPWEATEFIARIPCQSCRELVDVDVKKAADYYNEKILSCFSDVRGTVLDLGCGGGFITQHLLTLPQVTRVIALDSDPGCRENLANIQDSRLEFVLADAADLGKLFAPGSIDYAVSRDVFMFIENPEVMFADLRRVTRSGIRQMGWYKPATGCMKNTLTPEDVRAALCRDGWLVDLDYLDWYKSGYFIRAEKNNCGRY